MSKKQIEKYFEKYKNKDEYIVYKDWLGHGFLNIPQEEKKFVKDSHFYWWDKHGILLKIYWALKKRNFANVVISTLCNSSRQNG